MYFLDTNICIYFLNGRSESVRNRILSTPPNTIAIPSIVKAELLLGAFKSRNREANLDRLEKFLFPFSVEPFTDFMSYPYAEIRSDLELRGETIGPNDLLIASIVRFHDGILVTANVEEFRRVKGLQVENWTVSETRGSNV